MRLLRVLVWGIGGVLLTFVALGVLVAGVGTLRQQLGYTSERDKLLAQCKTRLRAAAGEAIHPLWEIGSPWRTDVAEEAKQYTFWFLGDALRSWRIGSAGCRCTAGLACTGEINWIAKPESVCSIDPKQACASNETVF